MAAATAAVAPAPRLQETAATLFATQALGQAPTPEPEATTAPAPALAPAPAPAPAPAAQERLQQPAAANVVTMRVPAGVGPDDVITLDTGTGAGRGMAALPEAHTTSHTANIRSVTLPPGPSSHWQPHYQPHCQYAQCDPTAGA